MGHNSIVLIRNDAFESIQSCAKGFVDMMVDTLSRLSWYKTHGGRERNEDFSGVDGHSNPAQAVWNEHADVTGLIAVGGNHATVLYKTWNGGRHHDPEDRVELLRRWATSIGYDLVKHRSAI